MTSPLDYLKGMFGVWLGASTGPQGAATGGYIGMTKGIGATTNYTADVLNKTVAGTIGYEALGFSGLKEGMTGGLASVPNMAKESAQKLAIDTTGLLIVAGIVAVMIFSKNS